ncbi:tRNA modification GTPase TrmE [Williamsoniiplasma somnilux]|uniref:tRNA modification GTPase MnmE n=1 Tax=Williamsoniiplasma somnilux TaxID=215578 RepID=A0A2K8P094_9MOLU|nr:tRNA uridine-5-carboxymethylaminomethyl(34) synthesis GTPase MnmE [Williamsoniiplasma somnilux]ATZ18421.1 tRNA modification GTPase TrmE [Williamsoniiplasma somnilux]
MKNINDTIVAPVTNISTQAIAVIRISGDDAFNIINKIVDKEIPLHRNIFLRKLFQNKQVVDEVVITSFVNPSSFTGENVIEIACHGGILNTNKIINLILNSGARMAQKGEFSQRAFLNGKIDLIQAEGINDLIHATNELALKIGVDNMSGSHNKTILDLKSDLMDVISRIQVSIDYPDYDDVEGSSPKDLQNLLKKIDEKLNQILLRSKLASKSASGIKTAIIGEPNVGKSSILNALLSEDKAIVTNVPGTTRDIVEGQISFQNFTLNLIDTAGIRETEDIVEALGIKKSLEYIKKADLVLFVITPEEISTKSLEIINLAKDKTKIIVVNKSENLNDSEKQRLISQFNDVVFTNALNNDINELISKIDQKYNNEEILKDENLILININQISLIEQVKNKINTAYINLQNHFPIDVVNVDLYEGWGLLNELIGEQYDEEIIDNIFRKYCLGK